MSKDFQFGYCGFRVYAEGRSLVAYENGEPLVAIMGDPDRAARLMVTMLAAAYEEGQRTLDVSSEWR